MQTETDREARKRLQGAEIDAIEDFFGPELTARVKAVLQGYAGDLTVLESALGSLLMARFLGWHAVRLFHSGPTIAKYERILSPEGFLPFHYRESFEPRTLNATRSNAIRVADAVGNFWAAAKGEISVPNRSNVDAEVPDVVS